MSDVAGRLGWQLASFAVFFGLWLAGSVTLYVVPSPMGDIVTRLSYIVFPLILLTVLLGASRPRWLAAITLAAMVGAQTIEGKLLAPHFVGRATGLHALAVLLALLAGAHTAGLIGALVAVPLLAGLWEIVRTLYIEPRRV